MKDNQGTKFYHDPIDQWVEDHPYLATLAGFVVGWFVIIALFTI